MQSPQSSNKILLASVAVSVGVLMVYAVKTATNTTEPELYAMFQGAGVERVVPVSQLSASDLRYYFK